MIYTIVRRKARCCGSLVTYYEVRQYTHRSKIGCLMNGETLATAKTVKEARQYCKDHNIEYIKEN